MNPHDKDTDEEEDADDQSSIEMKEESALDPSLTTRVSYLLTPETTGSVC